MYGELKTLELRVSHGVRNPREYVALCCGMLSYVVLCCAYHDVYKVFFKLFYSLVSIFCLLAKFVDRERVMPSFAVFCKWGARALFFALIIIQCFFLAAYPATYKSNSLWYVLATSFAPTVIVWLCLIASKAKLRWLFYVWNLYIICALIPNIAIVFLVVGDSLDKNKLLGPNALKLILCITPLLLLLLLHTADDSDRNEYRELVSKLSYQMAIDLFDAVDMIDIVLEENEHNFGIPNGFGAFMIVLACFSLVLSTWQLAENKLAGEETKIRYRTAFLRNIAEIFLVNLPFLIIRAVVFFKYGKDESIFIAKNGIAIILSVLEIHHIRVSRQATDSLA